MFDEDDDEDDDEDEDDENDPYNMGALRYSESSSEDDLDEEEIDEDVDLLRVASGMADVSEDGVVFGDWGDDGADTSSPETSPQAAGPHGVHRASNFSEHDWLSESSRSSSRPGGNGRGTLLATPKAMSPRAKREARRERRRDVPQQFLYIQMEFCGGKTLKDTIEAGLPKESEAWRLLRQVIEGLEYIHNANLIHRDLKPANIFLDSQVNLASRIRVPNLHTSLLIREDVRGSFSSTALRRMLIQ
jgi:serine/threonine protein kinase